MTDAPFSPAGLDGRIVFHGADEILEMSLAGLRFTTKEQIDALYDRVEERIALSGEQLWFFLVNYERTWIDSAVWFAFSQRGRSLNLAHSMGSVRFDPSVARRGSAVAERNGVTFDPNLHADRDSALAHLRTLRSKRWKKMRPAGPHPLSRDELLWRVAVIPDDDIMDVDLSHLTFQTPSDIDAVYDFIEARVASTGRRWYFLVNHEGTKISRPARSRYERRGLSLDRDWSLGAAGYAAGARADSRVGLPGQNAGLCASREEALARIVAMKAAATGQF